MLGNEQASLDERLAYSYCVPISHLQLAEFEHHDAVHLGVSDADVALDHQFCLNHMNTLNKFPHSLFHRCFVDL